MVGWIEGWITECMKERKKARKSEGRKAISQSIN
jgi:hypothetical protein